MQKISTYDVTTERPQATRGTKHLTLLTQKNGRGPSHHIIHLGQELTFNPLNARCCIYTTWKHVYALSESETTSDWNWEVVRDGEARRWGARWHRITYHSGLISRATSDILYNYYELEIYPRALNLKILGRGQKLAIFVSSDQYQSFRIKL